MKGAIEGPNCTDPSICHGDCCSIKIDVPKILAQEYIRRGFAKRTDFIRSNVFSFHLRFDEKTGKCFLFEKTINGCSVHHTGIKPPQCWIYPTNFSNPDENDIECKRASGWRIIDPNKARKAEKLLEEFIDLCKMEAKKSKKKILKRLKHKKHKLIKKLQTFPPSELGGVKDTWDHFEPLSAEGYSLQLKKFCKEKKKKCKYLEDNDFLSCPAICEIIAKEFVEFIKNHINEYIKLMGMSVDGHYPLIKFFEKITLK